MMRDEEQQPDWKPVKRKIPKKWGIQINSPVIKGFWSRTIVDSMEVKKPKPEPK